MHLHGSAGKMGGQRYVHDACIVIAAGCTSQAKAMLEQCRNQAGSLIHIVELRLAGGISQIDNQSDRQSVR